MFKKSTYLVGLTLFLVFGVNTIVFTNSAQPNAGHTGAPGDIGTCGVSGCHNVNASATTAMILNTVPFDQLATSYNPGQTYNVTINIASLSTPASGSPKDGFQLTVLDAVGNPAGTLALPANPATVSLTTLTGRQYIGHKNATSTQAWTFKWTAPAAGAGAVSFYVAANRTNNSSTSAGDNVYTQVFTVAEGTTNPCTGLNAFVSTPGNATSFCTGESLDLTAGSTGGPGNPSYLWSTGGTSQTININAAGTYGLTVTEGTCTATSSITVTSVAAGVADFSVTVFENVVTINNNSTGVDGNFAWDFGNGDSFADNSASFSYIYDSVGTYDLALTYTDVCGNTQNDFQQVTIDTVPLVGINETKLANVLSVYPNPFGSQASININGYNGANYQFVMVDITGKTVRNLQGVAGTPMSINRDGLQSGMYFYNITLNGETAQGKILID